MLPLTFNIFRTDADRLILLRHDVSCDLDFYHRYPLYIYSNIAWLLNATSVKTRLICNPIVTIGTDVYSAVSSLQFTYSTT
jgi:hypothetical protein